MYYRLELEYHFLFSHFLIINIYIMCQIAIMFFNITQHLKDI
jgi:hypothetical protein